MGIYFLRICIQYYKNCKMCYGACLKPTLSNAKNLSFNCGTLYNPELKLVAGGGVSRHGHPINQQRMLQVSKLFVLYPDIRLWCLASVRISDIRFHLPWSVVNGHWSSSQSAVNATSKRIDLFRGGYFSYIIIL